MAVEKWSEWLSPNPKEKVYIPNEIFNDFRNNEHISAKNIAFLYTYFCLVMYLYRYCKYGNRMYNNELLREIMGYAKYYTGFDHLIKKGGVLDSIGYTRTIRDFPIQYQLCEKFIEFEMYSQLDDETKSILNMPKNFSVKYPVKGFYRVKESKDENVYDGTFYEIENTHLFNVCLFVNMMSKGLNVNEFYLYQFIRHKNDLFKTGYNATQEQLEAEILIPKRTLIRNIQTLEDQGYVQVTRGIKAGKNTLPNTYKVKNQNALVR